MAKPTQQGKLGYTYHDKQLNEKWIHDGDDWTIYGLVTLPSGLEKLQGATGDFGWRLVGADPAKYAPIGNNSIDMSAASTGKTGMGAVGKDAFVVGKDSKGAGNDIIMGFENISVTGTMPRPDAVGNVMIGNYNVNEGVGFSSFMIGNLNKSTAGYAVAIGIGNIMVGDGTDTGGAISAVAVGTDLTAITTRQCVLGRNNIGSSLDTVLEFGNGLYSGYTPSTKKNALEIYNDNVVIAPEQTIALIDGFAANHATDNAANANLAKRVLITKEYLDSTTYIHTGLTKTEGATGKYGYRLAEVDNAEAGVIGENAIDIGRREGSMVSIGASYTNSVAIGNAGVHNMAGIAIGNEAIVFNPVLVRKDPIPLNQGSIALGFNVQALGSRTITIGSELVGANERTVVIGNAIDAGNFIAGSVMLGSYPDTSLAKYTDANFVIGAGTGTSDRKNLLWSDSKNVLSMDNTLIADITTRGAKALITKEYADSKYITSGSTGLEKIEGATGSYGWRLVGADPAVYGLIGQNAIDLSIHTTGTGKGAVGISSIVIGSGASSTQSNSIVIGPGATCSKRDAVVLGRDSSAFGVGAVALGSGARALGNGSIAIGYGPSCIADSADQIVLGHINTNQVSGNVIFGVNGNNFMTIEPDGTMRLPQCSDTDIENSTNDKTVITKEYTEDRWTYGIKKTTEGGNTGWRLDSVTKPPGEVAIGRWAIELVPNVYSGSYGVSCYSGIGIGYNTLVAGDRNNIAIGNESTITGTTIKDATILGAGTIAIITGQTVIGSYNEGNSGNIFEVGAGTAKNARSNIFEILINGVAVSPKAEIAEITAAAGKALITKEYLEDKTVLVSSKDAANGVAGLDANGHINPAVVPGSLSSVKEYANLAAFPATGAANTLYVALDTHKIYRWGGSVYVVVSETLAIGETSATAYRGDRGKVAYDYSLIKHLPLAGGILTGNITGTTATFSGASTFSSSLTVSGGLKIPNRPSIGALNLLGLDTNNNIVTTTFDEVKSGLLKSDGSIKMDSGYTSTDPLAIATVGMLDGIMQRQENLDVDSAAAEIIATVLLADYDAVFFDYSVKNGTNVRAGTVVATHDGTNVVYNDTATTSLGSADDVTFSVVINGVSLNLMATVTSDNWAIKSLIRGI